VRKKSLDRFKDKLRAKTGRTRGDSLQRIVTDLNRTLRGWFAYFKHADPFTFVGLDRFIRRRLRTLLRKQTKRSGIGHTLADHQRWPNAFFAQAGLLALSGAWRAARHPR
jgi:RNA-directed DNA polymerase